MITEGDMLITGLKAIRTEENLIEISWDVTEGADSYRIYWADKDTPAMKYKCIGEVLSPFFCIRKATHIPHYIKVVPVKDNLEGEPGPVLKTSVKKVFHEQLEKLSRGLVVVRKAEGNFLAWRMFLEEAAGYSDTGLTGTDYVVYKNGEKLCIVTDSTNYLDRNGTDSDGYSISALKDGVEERPSKEVKPWKSGENYIDIPLQIPKGSVTPAGETYIYHANDMSVGDIDGDREYEYFVKWDPNNSQDVSIKGYTGNCYIDCYKLSGQLLWRLDMGVNIRAGAHYTQFMVYDFNNDGCAEMAVKTAPGTKMTIYHADGSIKSEKYITMPPKDIADGYTHDDNYVYSAEDYKDHLIRVFSNWHNHPEVAAGKWPKTLEECFGIPKAYDYPLNYEDAKALVDYFIGIYAPLRSDKNKLEEFEGFIMTGPEYLTMFSGAGEEIQTIDFPFERVDDGLMWGDYSMRRIEPCNRSDRFLSGVAYLDGERPYLIICRGYYTRACIAAYEFFENRFKEHFIVDSGFVPMDNPFTDNPHSKTGIHPIYGILAGQGNHSLSTADVDGDGCQEIIYGGAVIDQDGSVLYSSFGYLPDGTYAKFGHGDAMHVACIDPDRPGLEIFNVFEGGKAAPYGYALREAETGEAIFGEYAETDLGRCMIGDINPHIRGLQVWVKDVYSCTGVLLPDKLLGTNFNIRWAGDMSTQILDGEDIFGSHRGTIQDNTHGIMLRPEGMATNNGTKGNPCLIADIFGDFREELLLRKADDSAIRIFLNAEITKHKLFTLMHDIQYRTGIAWQNNCYNQPCYTKFYYASDMDWKYVLPYLA